MLEEIVAIFKQLGVDATILHQFIIFTLVFTVLKVLLFDKLQFVLEHREGRTTKLDHEANKKFEEAEKLASHYKEKMSTIQREAQEKFKSKKGEINEKERQVYNKAQKEILDDLESQRNSYETDIKKKEDEILNQADTLAKDLVSKLT